MARDVLELLRGESVIFRANPHFVVLIPSMLVALLFFALSLYLIFSISVAMVFGIIMLVADVIFLAVVISIWKNTCITVTTERLFGTYGIITVRTTEIPIGNINMCYSVKTLFGHVADYGNLTVVSGCGKVHFAYIPNVSVCRRAIFTAIAKKAQRSAVQGIDYTGTTPLM